MGTIWLRDLDAVIADAGLTYRCWHDWQTRARSSGGYDKLWAVFAHHTASNTTPDNDCSYMWDSTSGDQPIGALHLDRSGRVTIGAAGATNCQGKGGAYATSHGTIPMDKGNAYGIAIEAANAGTGEAWPPAQQDAYVTLCAALCAAYGLDPARDVVAHFEWTSRKIDPAGSSRYAAGGNKWNMPAFRGDICAWNPTSPEPEPPPTPKPEPSEPEDDDMPALIITASGGATPGAVAVTDAALTAKRFIYGEDAAALQATGLYDTVTLRGETFDGIPGEASIDVVEGGR